MGSSHEAAVRRDIGDVHIRGNRPGEPTAALIAVVTALDLAHKVVDREGLCAGDVRNRAKEVADGDGAAKAVRDSIAAAHTAVTAAVVASTAAATSGSG